MCTYIYENEKRIIQSLLKKPSKKCYTGLEELLPAHMIIFNRKRSGESERTTVEDLTLRKDMPAPDNNGSQILGDEEKSYQEEQYVFKVTANAVRGFL